MNNDIRIIAKLGEGSFAEVYKVKNPKTQQVFAIKRLKKRYRTIEEVNKLPEVQYLKALQGQPNIIKLYEVIYNSQDGYVALLFELMDANLYEFVRDNQKPCDEKTSLLLIYQLLKALDYMHEKNLFHRDVKPENCMVNKATLELKLCDFGSTRAVSNSGPYTEYVSTRWYRAPECILTSGSYGREVDIWAVGCMLYELLTTRPLFPGKHEIDQISRIHNIVGTPSIALLNQFRKNPNTQISFSFPQRTPQDLHKIIPMASQETVDLMGKMLIYNPADRITAHDALLHPAFEQFRIAEVKWNASGCKVPFAVFYEQFKNQPVAKLQPPTVGPYVLDTGGMNTSDSTPMVIKNQTLLPPLPKQPSHHAPIIMQPMYQSHPVKPAGEFNPLEARRKAAQRIKEYNQKKLLNQKKEKKLPLPSFQFGAPTVLGSYQNPKPELIQPRLPRIQPYFH